MIMTEYEYAQVKNLHHITSALYHLRETLFIHDGLEKERADTCKMIQNLSIMQTKLFGVTAIDE